MFAIGDGEEMNREIVQKVIEEARQQESNLVIWDRRDTFTVEAKDLAELSTEEDHLRASMQDGRATVYVEYESIYKLVVEKERAGKIGARAGFGSALS
jgi:hypothetical protein